MKRAVVLSVNGLLFVLSSALFYGCQQADTEVAVNKDQSKARLQDQTECKYGTDHNGILYKLLGKQAITVWSSDNVNGNRCLTWNGSSEGDVWYLKYEWNLSSGGSIGRVVRDANSPEFVSARVDNMGPMVCKRTVTFYDGPGGDYNNMVYGWLGANTTDFSNRGTAEWYVIDDYNRNWAANQTNQTYLGQVTSDGSAYNCYRAWVVESSYPNGGFWQFTAFRLNKRTSGDVTLRNFMRFWRQHSLPNDYIIDAGIGCENFQAGSGRWEGVNITIPATNQ